jgi:hypothetical protein
MYKFDNMLLASDSNVLLAKSRRYASMRLFNRDSPGRFDFAWEEGVLVIAFAIVVLQSSPTEPLMTANHATRTKSRRGANSTTFHSVILSEDTHIIQRRKVFYV